MAHVDPAYTGEAAPEAAAAHGIRPGVVTRPRPLGRAARFRRPGRDYEPLATTLAGRHCAAFAIFRLHKAAPRL